MIIDPANPEGLIGAAFDTEMLDAQNAASAHLRPPRLSLAAEPSSITEPLLGPGSESMLDRAVRDA